MNQVSGCRDITSKSSGKKYGIVPARIYQITIIYCALLRQSRDTVPVAEHPYISYGLVTRTFPEHSCIPIYMHLCHIFFVSIYFRNLPITLKLQSGGWLVSRELEVQYVLSWPDPFDCQKCTISQSNYCLLVVASICMPISCLWLKAVLVFLVSNTQ